MPRRSHQALLIVVLAGYLILALGFSLVTPLFEAPDEHLHFYTAAFIQRERRLPTTFDEGYMDQEAAQPPLYYVLSALLTAPIDLTGAEDGLWLNPRADPGNRRGGSLAGPPINANLFIQTPADAWPWQGRALAAHAMRMLSTLFGLGTLLWIYAAARLVWPDTPDRALLAVALVAFLPQYAFAHGVITNDAAVIFFCTAGLWQLLRLRLEPPTTGHYLLLGLTIGLAMLSKAAGFLLLVYAVAVIVATVWARGRTRRWREMVRAGALILAPALLVGGWLLWRNWALYGDVTAAGQFVAIAGGDRHYTLRQVWHDMDRVWASLFAFFGWMNVIAPRWIHVIWNGIIVAAAGGAAWAGLQALTARREGDAVAPSPYAIDDSRWGNLLLHPATILLGWVLLVAAAWLLFMLRTPADQGRLFYPAILCMALGVAFGLWRWPRPWVPAVAVLLALATSVYSLAVVVPDAYARPPLVAELPAEAVPLDHVFPQGLELLGARVETAEATTGDWVWATLYWRAAANAVDGAPQIDLELFDGAFHRVGQMRSYHGRGNYPSTLWPEGAIVADRLAARVTEEVTGPSEATIAISLNDSGEAVDIGAFKLAPAAWPEADGEPLATLGDGVELLSAEVSNGTAAPGETVEVRLRWHVIEAPGPALLHAFVHLGDPAEPPLAQADGPVMGGRYPNARWAAGEVFDETISLALPGDLPPGDYPLQVGLYVFETGERLPVTVGGAPQPSNTVPLGRLLVE